ncbi:tumor necrosis factor receptor superfamily member 10A-like isoform X3 [Mastacembelus armatus]|uniref:tumor necrosis factor receptor superfamily member 10A-like isoform X3 n=1 Tax=Mastacembelus armatus TaxID=205130 RepID=UPI000E456BB9|nr:tumor necrosis factor receptor superfamily member 10A-like isoform X3 [Mastacembelus armatus]
MKSMFKLLASLLVIFISLKLAGAFPRTGLGLGGRRMQRDVSCRDNLEYVHGNICCLNCPAGTHMKLPCSRQGEKGQCEECAYGMYTEHSNGLKQCFKCTQCRSDQEIVKPCTPTQNTECQCKSGTFCAPDQACEVCLKCSRCGKDEKIVRNCIATTNTECKKIQPISTFDSESEVNSILTGGDVWSLQIVNTAVIVSLVVILPFIVAIVFWICWIRKRRATDAQRSLHGEMKEQHYTGRCPTVERKVGESQRSSYSNWPLEHEQFPDLSPVNGEESLRNCFEHFEQLDVDYFKRFFRRLGISDNMIKSKEPLPYDDRIHELLNYWVEKKGKEASLNDLLKVLLDLNQRRTAEMVKENAVQFGHYICEA